jgi:hypothetical protein
MATNKIYGDPASINLDPGVIGYDFTVEVKIEDGVDVAGASVGASWDPSVIMCDTGGPNGGIDNGSFLVGPPDYDLLALGGTIDNVAGEINPKYGWSALGGYLASGNGTLAYIDFTTVDYGFTWINLSVVLSDEYGVEYTILTENVSVNVEAPPPPPPRAGIVTWENDPESSTGLPPGMYLNGSTVSIIPTVVQTSYNNVSDTYGSGDAAMMRVLYPNGSVAQPWGMALWFMGPMPFVYTFNAADESELGDWTIELAVQFMNMYPEYPDLAWSNETHTKTIVLPATGAILDLYTESERAHGYIATQIGVGACIPADSYTMDENVTLWVNLTYNGAELQSRLIAWEVKDGTNTTVLYRTTYTDAYGVSTISFRIMTVCMDPEHAAGQWCVVAKTTVGEVIVEDYLTFEVGYIVYLWEDLLAPTPFELERGGMYFWFYGFFTIALEPRNVTYTCTLFDDLGVPVMVFATQITTMGVATWVKDPNATCCYSWTLEPGLTMGAVFFMIPKWAYPGSGAWFAHDIYTDYPFSCGTAWGPEVIQPAVINA